MNKFTYLQKKDNQELNKYLENEIHKLDKLIKLTSKSSSIKNILNYSKSIFICGDDDDGGVVLN